MPLSTQVRSFARRRSVRFVAGVLAGLLGLALIAYLALEVAPDIFVSDAVCRRRAQTHCLDAGTHAWTRLGVAAVTLAVLALGLGIVAAVYAARSLARTRLAHDSREITVRLIQAVTQLGSPVLEVRLGGIYALERLARDSADVQPEIVEVLAAYVREHAGWGFDSAREEISGLPAGVADRSDAIEAPDVPTDVRAAMTVLGRRDPSRDRAEYQLELGAIDLRRLVLLGDQAQLAGARLAGAHLEGADLEGARLEYADLEGAHLEGAYLEGARMQGALLIRAHLEGAHLDEARMDGACLERAHLEGAHLVGAHLEQANLESAHLEGAFLGEAHLVGAQLDGAHLEGAYLHQADFEGARLGKAHLRGTRFDDSTRWPTDFDPIAAGARRVAPLRPVADTGEGA